MPDHRSRANRVPGFNLDGSPDRRFRTNREGTPEPVTTGAAAELELEPDAADAYPADASTSTAELELEPDAAAPEPVTTGATRQQRPRRASFLAAEEGILSGYTPGETLSGVAAAAAEAAEELHAEQLAAAQEQDDDEIEVQEVVMHGRTCYWAETGDTWFHFSDEFVFALRVAPAFAAELRVTPRPQTSLRDAEAFARGVRVFPVRVTQPVFAFLEQELTQDIHDKGNEKCAVCLEAQKCGDQAIVLACHHAFHKACMRPWLREHTTCPVCRSDAETGEPQTTAATELQVTIPEPEPEPEDFAACVDCAYSLSEGDFYMGRGRIMFDDVDGGGHRCGVCDVRVEDPEGMLPNSPTEPSTPEPDADADAYRADVESRCPIGSTTTWTNRGRHDYVPTTTEPAAQPDPEREPEPTTEPESDDDDCCGTCELCDVKLYNNGDMGLYCNCGGTTCCSDCYDKHECCGVVGGCEDCSD